MRMSANKRPLANDRYAVASCNTGDAMIMTTQPTNGTIELRERIFQVKRAEVSLQRGSWGIEIETDGQEFDRENWAPYLYHQGLRIDATNAAELQGRTVRWYASRDPDYEHPEIGSMYVFGHHDVRQCVITFGEIFAGRIELSWTGLCDVFWDVSFKENVPFRCKCRAVIKFRETVVD